MTLVMIARGLQSEPPLHTWWFCAAAVFLGLGSVATMCCGCGVLRAACAKKIKMFIYCLILLLLCRGMRHFWSGLLLSPVMYFVKILSSSGSSTSSSLPINVG